MQMSFVNTYSAERERQEQEIDICQQPDVISLPHSCSTVEERRSSKQSVSKAHNFLSLLFDSLKLTPQRLDCLVDELYLGFPVLYLTIIDLVQRVLFEVLPCGDGDGQCLLEESVHLNSPEVGLRPRKVWIIR